MPQPIEPPIILIIIEIMAKIRKDTIMPKEVDKKSYFGIVCEEFLKEINLEIFIERTGSTQGIKLRIKPAIKLIIAMIINLLFCSFLTVKKSKD